MGVGTKGHLVHFLQSEGLPPHYYISYCVAFAAKSVMLQW